MARTNEQSDLDRLVTQHLPAALRFATRLAGSVDAAEEIVQESLMRVARSWRTFRAESEFRTWLFRIVINVFRDSVVAKPPGNATLRGQIIDPHNGDPSIDAQRNELGALIACHVSTLPPRQREVMVLIAFEGLSTNEVAELLGITAANVHATLRIARERLRKELGPYFADR